MSWEVSDNFHESAQKYYSRDLFYNQPITKVLQWNFANEYKYIIKQTRNTASVPCICCIANLTSFSVTDGNSSTPLCTRKHLNPLIPALTMGLISACFNAHAHKKVFLSLQKWWITFVFCTPLDQSIGWHIGQVSVFIPTDISV